MVQSNIYQYESFPRALLGIIRAGPSELFKGFVPSAMRDAPYAGLFVACYEGIKRETGAQYLSQVVLTTQSDCLVCMETVALVMPTSAMSSAGVHTFAAASAGAIATLATHPFDVIKVVSQTVFRLGPSYP